jgi:hypothetical protein
MSAERERVAGFGRLEDGLRQASDWYRWGPYLSERQWGTVREDYSPDGQAWDYLPHDHARSRAYRWGEDGLAGFSDVEQRLCLSLALWNGRDPILKERAFGLTGSQGNHGEDVKEHWWYLDSIPSHAWNRWRYHYPQAAYPYQNLIEGNAARDRHQPEYELIDTGVFGEDRYWVVEMVYAKASPDDLLMTVTVTNMGPDTETLHVLPTAWFRNTWSWDGSAPSVLRGDGDGDGDSVVIEHPFCGELELIAGPGPDGTTPAALFCENETNIARLFGGQPVTAYPKDGINDHVVSGAPTVNPQPTGTKCAFWYQLTVPAGQTAEIRLRLRPRPPQNKPPQNKPPQNSPRPDEDTPDEDTPLGAEFTQVMTKRQAEADEFYAELTPPQTSADEAMVMRQAFAGLLWSKQFYRYDVARWLDGDPAQPAPPAGRESGRNAAWREFDAFDIMSMPDKWEYPWFAAWDLAFHCLALAHVDPAFAKYQLILICREWFQNAGGALPAYEWDFSDVNPPVQAWAALEVFTIDGGSDLGFLSRMFDKMLVNFTWWVNLKDPGGKNAFDGGFLGLDNIGPIDRSHLPPGATLQESDATGWMGFYAMTMGVIAGLLGKSGQRPGDDLVIKFLEHFAAIRDALDSQDLWDPDDGMYYDRLITADGAQQVRVRSMVGMIPALSAAVFDEADLGQALTLNKRFADRLRRQGLASTGALRARGILRERKLLLSLASPDRLERLLSRLFDEGEFLSPHGLRALSAYHREHPYQLQVDGVLSTVDYEPAESTTPMFGGNSNWRGPVWFPLNYLVIGALERYYDFYGDQMTVEYPTGSGNRMTLDKIAADLRDRLISLFTRDADGRRACFGTTELQQTDPAWRDNLVFSEYFNGDTGAALGAWHQTGWTGLIADVIRRRHGAVRPVAEVVRSLEQETGT